jgi:serine/threonine protein kinase
MPITVSGYLLGQEIGRGKHSVVHQATDPDFGSSVAVKLLTQVNAKTVRLLRRELSVGFSVRHRHIVRVLGGNDRSAPYHIVMELLSGESLRERLTRRHRLGVSEVIAIGRQVALALQALHAAGFVHADVKPENIRILDNDVVKLIDYGFAHRPGDDDLLHAQGVVLGTANYLAPELCRRPIADGFAADLFSLGVTLFEALTGELPYRCGTTQEVVASHRRDRPKDLCTRGRYPSQVVTLIQRLLAAVPADRPTAHALAAELGSLQIQWLGRRVA